MTRKNGILLLIILLIFVFALWALLPIDAEKLGRKGLRLGLDLVGGVHLVYEVDVSENTTEHARNISRTLTTIQQRIDKYGVTEPVIQKMGEERILIQLPGFTDIDAAKSLVEQTGFLEFREVELTDEGKPVTLGDYLKQAQLQLFDRQEKGERIFVATMMDEEGNTQHRTAAFLVVDDEDIRLTDPAGNPVDNEALNELAGSLSWIPARGDDGTPLTGEFLADAAPTISGDITPRPQVAIEWNSEGGRIFDEIARRLYSPEEDYSPQYLLGIFLDDTLLSSPKINEPAYHGSGVITGRFTRAEVEELANLLKSGALPMPLKQPPLYQEKVSATLGANFIQMSWMAGLIGIILVMLFMIAYYRLPGLLASLALIFYGAFVLALFKLIPVTLSLAGLGGFILSIGMAVDANVLIFERMKEEIRMGRTLGAAAEAGFNRAWSAIRDSNVTTIIVCIILFWLGSSIVASAPVMGFALTLGIGVIVSMFTAIVVTRTLLRIFIHSPLSKKTALFSIARGRQ